jgi:hypothetical protein
MNGVTIGYLGYLMEISPDDRRPAYSAYFNALASPAALAPLVGGGLCVAGVGQCGVCSSHRRRVLADDPAAPDRRSEIRCRFGSELERRRKGQQIS